MFVALTSPCNLRVLGDNYQHIGRVRIPDGDTSFCYAAKLWVSRAGCGSTKNSTLEEFRAVGCERCHGASNGTRPSKVTTWRMGKTICRWCNKNKSFKTWLHPTWPLEIASSLPKPRTLVLSGIHVNSKTISNPLSASSHTEGDPSASDTFFLSHEHCKSAGSQSI